MAHSHGKKIRLIEFKGYYNQKIYEVQEFIKPGLYPDIQGWHPRNRPYDEGSKEKAIELFNKYLQDGIPHAVWPVDYINPYCDMKILQEGIVKKKLTKEIDFKSVNDEVFLLAA